MNANMLALHATGQSLWVDNITRKMLGDDTLKGYIANLWVTNLTSNPTIFEQALSAGDTYDEQIGELAGRGAEGEDLFFTLALRDLTRAADLFKPVYDDTDGVDGWVSLEVSPLIVDDTRATAAAAKDLHALAARPNLYIKIPGTPAGVQAIEDSIVAGVPVNVTLLFSREQYLVVAEAYMRGIERRLAAGLDPKVESVASLFVSRWDVVVKDEVGPELRNRLGIAISKRTYKAYRDLLASPRWQKLAAAGAHPQRLLWASTGVKDPATPDTLYIEELAAPGTVNTMPDKTIKAFADHGKVAGVLAADGADAEAVLAEFAAAGVDIHALALRLQHEAADAFAKSWNGLLAGLKEKSATLAGAASQ